MYVQSPIDRHNIIQNIQIYKWNIFIATLVTLVKFIYVK